MKQLLYNHKLQAACPLPFDEAKLWQGQSGPQLKQQIQKQLEILGSSFISEQFYLITTVFLDSEIEASPNFSMC